MIVNYTIMCLLFILVNSDMSSSRPWELLARIEPLLKSASLHQLNVEDSLKLYTTAADAYTAARDYPAATQARERVVELRNQALKVSPSSLSLRTDHILSRVSLVEAYSNEGRYNEALEVISKTEADTDSPEFLKGLSRARAQVLNCAGDILGAVAAFQKGLPKGTPWPAEGATFSKPSEVKLALDYHLLLSRLNGSSSDASRVGKALLRTGPWKNVSQLPRKFNPALISQPWYNVSSPPWSLGSLIAALSAATPALRDEFTRLRSHPILKNEAECIADRSRGGAVWRYATVNAPWVKDIDSDGCSLSTPVACGLLKMAREEGWGGEALRGTYSAVEGGGVLRVHCGLTNAQIKLHVGLMVPSRVILGDSGEVLSSEPCAALTVAGKSEFWREGGVLMFDDSFEHSVVNNCGGDVEGGERVVFQLVLPHGDARGKKGHTAYVGGD